MPLGVLVRLRSMGRMIYEAVDMVLANDECEMNSSIAVPCHLFSLDTSLSAAHMSLCLFLLILNG